METLRIDDRNNDLWVSEDDDNRLYALQIMYSTGGYDKPRIITAGPYKSETVRGKLEYLLNDFEQGRYACLNSHFVNPKYVILVRVNRWKDKTEREYQNGEFYD